MVEVGSEGGEGGCWELRGLGSKGWGFERDGRGEYLSVMLSLGDRRCRGHGIVSWTVYG